MDSLWVFHENAEFDCWFIAPNEIFPMWTTDAKHFKIL